MKRTSHTYLFLFATMLFAGTLLSAPTKTLEQTFKRGDVSLTIQATPSILSDTEDVDIALALVHPEELDVALPTDFTDRFEGLAITGSYEGETVAAGGIKRREVHVHARPKPGAERLRIAPFSIRWKDPASGTEKWFPTRSIMLEHAPSLTPSESLEENLQPITIMRSAREILHWIALVLGGLLGLGAMVMIVRFIRHRVRIARMAPRERALFELQVLLERGLAEKGKFKEFYIELTHVVRRYIERRHGIRAPKQTTEEFLQSALESKTFDASTLARLQTFLTSADLIKFAGREATTSTAAESVASARAYLEAEPKESIPKKTAPTP